MRVYRKHRIVFRPLLMSLSTFPMPRSSLEDRVRLLCERAVAATTQTELDAILPDLRAAIRDHIRYVRAIALETIPEAFGNGSNATD
jgi:hypothetical protein